ncbi:hypothetical protein FMM05_17885 [Flavobacterium zepuense]|uniref:Uncharacterized protein n=1 Tax=Flavobacterium zepuense TaxID=2593302 RepID=A0A552UVX7_9FLAO|nr:hypothetical protein [Flavobacterium zepuense]TRW22376.1 hypothetical protein FMM05_17885 [Flavobacterium zepuense]
MENREYGLLGFHFMIPLQEKRAVKSLFSDFTIDYITKNYTEEISVETYDALVDEGNFEETITAYIGTDDDCSFSITYHNGYLEVWFGFYPGIDITGYQSLLRKLNELADYSVAGFEVQIGSAVNEEGDEEELSPNFHPYCLLRNGELKWCGKGVSDEMESLIEENLKTVGLIE